MSRIVKTPGVCGGRACIEGTRIAVWFVVVMLREGASMRELARQYSRLTRADVEAAATYAEGNSAEIEQDIKEQEWS